MNTQTEAPTLVRFYVQPPFDVLAVFPKEIADYDGNKLCYQHVGQHGAASPAYYRRLKRAYPHQFKPLYQELESIGYNLTMR